MIRPCGIRDFETIHEIINAASQVYKGVIPADRWKEPYMSKAGLHREIDQGVSFFGYEEKGELLGVMGIQHVRDVTLIRHAYVRPDRQNQGIGSTLLNYLHRGVTCPVLIGTWADAKRSIRFYQKHGFQLVSRGDKDRLLRAYWKIPERQIETSVVLADATWFGSH